MLLALASGWRLLVLRGIAGILLGFILCTDRGITVASAALIYSAYALADGGLAILEAGAALRSDGRWGVLIADGVVGVAAGVAAFPWPGITVAGLIQVIAPRAIAGGLAQAITAARLRKCSAWMWPLEIWAMASILFGVVAMAAPAADLAALTVCVGGYALGVGPLLIIFGHWLRAWLKNNNLGEDVSPNASGCGIHLAGILHGGPRN